MRRALTTATRLAVALLCGTAALDAATAQEDPGASPPAAVADAPARPAHKAPAKPRPKPHSAARHHADGEGAAADGGGATIAPPATDAPSGDAADARPEHARRRPEAKAKAEAGSRGADEAGASAKAAKAGRPKAARPAKASPEPVAAAPRPATPLSLRVPSTLSVLAGRPLSLVLQTVGGAPGEVVSKWSAEGLPGGLELDGTGTLRGTPAAVGSNPVTVRATTSTGAVVEGALVLSVVPSASAAPAGASSTLATVPDLSLPLGRPFQSASSLVTPLGYVVQPVLVRVASALPPGLAVDVEGHLVGTPTKAGSYPVTLEVSEGGSVRLRTNPFVIDVH